MKYSNKRAKAKLEETVEVPFQKNFNRVVFPKQKTPAELGAEEAMKYSRLVIVQNCDR